MKRLYTLFVPDGFLLKETQQVTDIEQARLILRTRAQHRYTSAKRMGERALLTRHKLVCPCCGQSFPLFALRPLPGLPRKSRIPCSEIDAWADPQTRFPGIEESELIFREVNVPGEFLCPRCGHRSEPRTRTHTVTVGTKRQKITVTCPAADLNFFFSAPVPDPKCAVPLPLPLTERLTFNLRNGHTSLQIIGSDGTLCCSRDIAPGSREWADSTVCHLLKAKPVCRTLLRAFARLYGAPLPFTKENAAPESFLLMTLFRGYSSRHFFDAVPY